MSKNTISNISIENAKIILRNFSGEESKFNRKGDRSFGVIIEDQKVAEELSQIGWNVKAIKNSNPDENDIYFIKVAVSYDNYPPKVIMVTQRKKSPLDSSNIGNLDFADIKTVDLIISPYCWEVNGNRGIKAYLKTMYVTIEEDEFAYKYED